MTSRPTIEVPIKPAFKSWGFMGTALAAGSALFLGLQTALQTPGGLAAWCGNLQDKYGQIGLIVLGLAGGLYGNIKRPEVILNPNNMRRLTEEAANKAMTALTVAEIGDTAKDVGNALANPTDLNEWVKVVTGLTERLDSQDKQLARIEQAATANQFPPMADYPDRTDLPRDPRQMAQVAQPPVQWEPDVTMANSEGVLEGY